MSRKLLTKLSFLAKTIYLLCLVVRKKVCTGDEATKLTNKLSKFGSVSIACILNCLISEDHTVHGYIAYLPNLVGASIGEIILSCSACVEITMTSI